MAFVPVDVCTRYNDTKTKTYMREYELRIFAHFDYFIREKVEFVSPLAHPGEYFYFQIAQIRLHLRAIVGLREISKIKFLV